MWAPWSGRSSEGLGVTGSLPALGPLGRDLDVFDLAGRCGNSKTVFAHTFEMELDGFADLGFNLRDGCSRSDTTWKVRYIGGEVAFRLLNHDGISHTASLLQARLLQDAVLRARCEVIARPARNSDATGLAWVLELAMTSTGCYEIPTILLQQPDDFAHLHRNRIAGQCSKWVNCVSSTACLKLQCGAEPVQ